MIWRQELITRHGRFELIAKNHTEAQHAAILAIEFWLVCGAGESYTPEPNYKAERPAAGLQALASAVV